MQHELIVCLFLFFYSRWSELGKKSAQFLKMSVLSCLMETEKHQLSSIAVPAISCGVFGGSPDESAKLIVEAIVEFCDLIKKPFLKRVSHKSFFYF